MGWNPHWEKEGGREVGGWAEAISITIYSGRGRTWEDALIPLAITSIWSIEINIYMVSVSQNLSFRVGGVFS